MIAHARREAGGEEDKEGLALAVGRGVSRRGRRRGGMVARRRRVACWSFYGVMVCSGM
jgi:hypothetical protein